MVAPQDQLAMAPKKRSRTLLPLFIVIVLLIGLPVAVWLDLRSVSEHNLRRQAEDLNLAITNLRTYYADNVVGRIMAAHGKTTVSDNYKMIPGAIPIPATLSIELGQVVSNPKAGVTYRFFSDYPFKGRAPHAFDQFEKNALISLRRQPQQEISEVNWTANSDQVRIITPIIMSATCVACHNSHPRSTKRDWKVGDVRGLQEVSITQPIATSLNVFKYLPAYFIFMALVGFLFIALQRRQAKALTMLNQQISTANKFLTDIANKIARYISPQIYKSIFSGEKDVVIHTERKKLTIFFSDIKDFTSTTDKMQPEAMTALLNEYFTEMSNIALQYGGTIDKFVGDAMLVFFGDPETKGATEDAKACVRMALAMQRRLAELNVKWRAEGIERPFHVRMGINTGYCNVGNFGGNVRMDYTIIGGEVNLAARLQSCADEDRVVLSYETWALVRDILSAHPLPPVSLKGIGREVVPYLVEGLSEDAEATNTVISETTPGLSLYLDLSAIEPGQRDHARELLRAALRTLDANKKN